MNKKHNLIPGYLLAGLLSTAPISDALAQNVSFSQKQTSLKTVIAEIEKQSDMSVDYDASNVDASVLVTTQSINGDPASAISAMLKGTGYTCEVKGKHIIIKKEEPQKASATGNRTITGTIVDEFGEGAIGATVQVEGTTIGTITDMDGNYSLSNVPENANIIISYIGYQNQVFKAGDTNALANIQLKVNNEMLEEVVVVGYGTQKKVNLTGAVATISADDIKDRPAATAANVLQGADPSVNLTFNTGTLDSDYSIDIRGVASVNGGSPLVLADGMEVSLNQINPNDIESISVLKDASAASIYGAKASSGVILITTKQGKDKEGKANVSYNGRMGWKQNTTTTDFISTGYDYVDIVNRFYKSYNNKLWLSYDDEGMKMLADRRNDKSEDASRPWVTTDSKGNYMYYGNFDWYNYFFESTRPEQEHNVSINGGNDKIKYFVSGRILDQDGIFKIYNDNYRNYSFRGKLDAKLNNRLNYTMNVSYNSNEYKYAGYHNEQQTLYFLSYNLFPTVVPRNPDGTIVQYINQMTGNSPLGGGHGGYLTANEARNSRNKSSWVLSNQLDYKILDNLVLTASYAYKQQTHVNKYRGMQFDYSKQEGVTTSFKSGTVFDYYKEAHRTITDHNLNIYATYNETWNKAHNFKFVAGGQYEDYRNVNMDAERDDLLSHELSSMSVATGVATLTQQIGAYRTLGFFGRANYDYKGRYLLEVSGRWDGSSRFASNDRWGFFPSASMGWRFSDESFMKPIQNVINNGKLRFSAGSLGNQQVDYYAYFDEISTDNQMSYTFDGTTKAYYANVTNPKSSNLTWETVTTYDLGLDLTFLNNRLNVTADYYIRKTTDMLTTSLTLPSVFGAQTPKANCADMRTNGWELYVGWNDSFKLAGKKFGYNVSATIGDYKSTITKYNNPDKLISDYYEGMTMGEIWGYKVAGLFASNEEAAAYQAKIDDKNVNGRVYNSKTENKLMAGDVQFIDVDGDNVISEGSGTVDNPGDKCIIGNTLPRYSYTFRLGANYAGFDFSMFFQGVGKQNWYPTQYSYNFWGPYSLPSVSFIEKDFIDRCWSEDNPDGYFPRQRGNQAYSGGSLATVNDRYLQNVAYLRLKNVTLGYTIPGIKKYINSARVYFTGENLFCWSPLRNHTKSIDPELTNTKSTYQAGSGNGYGYSRTFSVGIDITF